MTMRGSKYSWDMDIDLKGIRIDFAEMKHRCIKKIPFSVTDISNYDIPYSRRCYSSVWSRPCVRKLYKLCKCVSHTHPTARPNMYLRNDYLPSLKKQNCFEVVPPRCHTITDFFLSLSSPSSSHPPRCDTITDPLKKIELFKALASPAFIGNSYWFLYKLI